MCHITKDGLQRMIVDAAVELRRAATRDLRREGMEFLLFAREWLRLGHRGLAAVAVENARSVLRDLWTTERMLSSRH